MNKRLKRICESNDWSIYEDNNHIELSKYSPAGEDFNFAVEKENCIQNVIEYAENFDAGKHAEMWVNNMHNVNDVPQSI